MRSAAKDYIRTHHGLKVDVFYLRPEMVRAHDMAYHLARQCRYNGFMHKWYSNAEHSVLGMELLETPEEKRQFLVHDAGEMVSGDVPYPVKAMCPDYKRLADEIQSQFNFYLFGCFDFLPGVKEADYLITATEQHLLRGQPLEDMMMNPLEEFKFYCWEWQDAMKNWLDAFRTYFPEWSY